MNNPFNLFFRTGTSITLMGLNMTKTNDTYSGVIESWISGNTYIFIQRVETWQDVEPVVCKKIQSARQKKREESAPHDIKTFK